MSNNKEMMDLINKIAEVTYKMEILFKSLPESERHAPKFVNPLEKQLNVLYLKHQLTFFKKEAEKIDIEAAKEKKLQQIKINQMILEASMDGLNKEPPTPSGGPIDPKGKDKPPALKTVQKAEPESKK